MAEVAAAADDAGVTGRWALRVAGLVQAASGGELGLSNWRVVTAVASMRYGAGVLVGATHPERTARDAHHPLVLVSGDRAGSSTGTPPSGPARVEQLRQFPALRSVRVTKLLASEYCAEVTNESFRIHGGYGSSKEYRGKS